MAATVEEIAAELDPETRAALIDNMKFFNVSALSKAPLSISFASSIAAFTCIARSFAQAIPCSRLSLSPISLFFVVAKCFASSPCMGISAYLQSTYGICLFSTANLCFTHACDLSLIYWGGYGMLPSRPPWNKTQHKHTCANATIRTLRSRKTWGSTWPTSRSLPTRAISHRKCRE